MMGVGSQEVLGTLLAQYASGARAMMPTSDYVGGTANYTHRAALQGPLHTSFH